MSIALGLAGSIAVLGLLSLGVGIACREQPVEAPEPIVPGPIGIAFSDAGSDAASTDAGEPPRAPYPLDYAPRTSALTLAGCPDVPLVDYVGEPIAWRPLFRVTPVFVPSVRALEAVIAETTREIYGKTPSTLLSASGYRCTTVRGRPERISEHALGNAIDLRGIELDDGTTITVRDHWRAHEEDDPRHARFWRLLVTRVHERDLFRGIIGPPDADHMDHLHFDQGRSSFFDLSLD